MSESNVTIKIDIDAKTGAIERVRSELAALAAQAELAEKRFRDIADSSRKLNRDFISLDKEVRQKEKDFDNMSGAIDRNERSMKKNRKETDRAGKGMKTFTGILKKVVSLLLKGFLISFALSAAALISFNLALKAGSAIAKGYTKVMSGTFQVLTVAGAAAVTVLAALAAGQREYAAAVSSSKYRNAQSGALYEATTQMRALTANTELAVLGSEALQAAFAGINKHARMTGGMATAMQAMGDFIATAGDPKKAAAAAGEFLGLLAKEGKLSSNVVKAAAAVGPEFEKAVKEASKKGMSSSGAFLKALVGGELSTEVAGQLGMINNTLFGTAKRYFQIIKSDFADFGQPLLGPFTKAMDELGKIFRRTFMSISGVVNTFAQGTFIDSLVGMADKFGYWIGKTFNEYLPKAAGMFDRISAFWDNVKYGFSRFADWMRPLAEGGQVLIDMFGPMFSSIFGGFNNGLGDLTDELLANKDSVLQFGESVGRLFGSIGKIFGELKEVTIQVMPFLGAVANVLSTIADILSQVMGVFNNLGSFGSLAMLIGGGIGYYKLGKMGQSKTGSKGGGLFDRGKRAFGFGGGGTAAQTVNMSAGVVYLNGPVSGGGGGAPVAGGGGRGAKGAAASSGRFGRTKAAFSNAKGFLGNNASMIAAIGLPLAGSYLESQGISGAGAAGTIAGLGALTGGFGLSNVTLPGKAGPMGAAGPTAILAGSYLAGSIGSNFALGTEWGQGLGTAGQKGLGVGAGALTGAAAGAAIGSFIPVIGTGVGAAVGAVVGGISGWINAGKNEKKAKEAAQAITGEFSSAIEESLAKGDIKGAQKLEEEMLRNQQMLAETTPDAEAFNKEFNKTADQIKNMNDKSLKQYNKNLKMLSATTGRSTEEVARLADEMGVNLVGTIDDVGAAVSQLTGMPQFKTGKEVESFATTGFAGVITEYLSKPQQLKEMGAAVDQAGDAIRQSLQEGLVPDRATLSNYLMTGFQYELAMGASPAEALSSANRRLGIGGLLYGTGGDFAGFQDILGPEFQTMLGGIVTELGKKTPGGFRDTLVTNIVSNYPELSRAKIESELDAKLNDAGLSITEKIDAISELIDTSAASEEFANAGQGVGAFAAEVERINGQLRVIDFRYINTILNDRGSAGAGGVYGMGGNPTVTTPGTGGSGGTKGMFDNPNPPSGDGSGDSSSPRSNLFNALKINSALNNSTFGKRQITSGIRNFNLGSINSDHTTGRALDITGQNLGMYASAMRDIGGFADFHGRGGDRHLHVVPPDATGDTAAPIPSMSPVSTSSSTSNQYSIVINPSQNASAQQIAEAVMQRIYREQRSARERQ